MRALSILALVLSLVFFTAVVSQPIFAATQKSSNNGNNGDNDGGDQNQDQVKNQEKKEEKEQNKEDKNQNNEQNKEQNKDDKNLNKEQNKEQNKEDKNQNKEQNGEDKDQSKKQSKVQNKTQVRVKTKNPEVEHGISRTYEDITASFPILDGLTFSADITFEILWAGSENDVNLSAKGNNYRAKIDEGRIEIEFSGVEKNGELLDNIGIKLSIEGGLFNQHSPASRANANGKAELYLRAKTMTVIEISGIEIAGADLILEHPMIKIQDGKLQFIKIANDDIVDQYLAPPRVENKQYTTFGKIKSAN